jgi:hypothetical protein
MPNSRLAHWHQTAICGHGDSIKTPAKDHQADIQNNPHACEQAWMVK